MSPSEIEGRFHLARGAFVLDVEINVPGRGITAVFGPSGSGKTTLLRCLAGLEPARGRLTVNGHCWHDDARGIFVPPHRRALGFVFQEARLFPHLTVEQNLVYGWKRTPARARRLNPDAVTALMGVGALARRLPHSLSGGEHQRVAIARALLASPELLMLDEPLAALDLAGRAEILPYLERLHEELALPMIYVSHALEEVMRLADHALMLDAGRVVAAGRPAEMLTRLDSPLAKRDAACTILEGVVDHHDEIYHLTAVRFGGGQMLAAGVAASPGQPVRVRVEARDVSVTLERGAHTSIQNIFPARVLEIADYNPAQCMIRLDLNHAPLLARITRKSCVELGLAPGRQVYAQIKSVAVLA